MAAAMALQQPIHQLVSWCPNPMAHHSVESPRHQTVELLQDHWVSVESSQHHTVEFLQDHSVEKRQVALQASDPQHHPHVHHHRHCYHHRR